MRKRLLCALLVLCLLAGVVSAAVVLTRHAGSADQSADEEDTKETEVVQTTSDSIDSETSSDSSPGDSGISDTSGSSLGDSGNADDSGSGFSGSAAAGTSGTADISGGSEGDLKTSDGDTGDTDSDIQTAEIVEGSNSDEYSIAALAVENAAVTATVNAADACTLVVTFYAEDGTETVGPLPFAVSTAQDMGAVSFTVTDTLPEYFLVSAVLEDGDGNALSDTFTSSFYTEAYQAFFALKPTDEKFEDFITIDYGNDNFCVLTEGSKQETGAYSVTGSEGDEAYTFTPNQGDSIAVGDILLLTGNIDAGELPVLLKVGAVTVNSDASVTVTADDNAALSDFYQVLRIDTVFGGIVETDGTDENGDTLSDDSSDSSEKTDTETADATADIAMTAAYTSVYTPLSAAYLTGSGDTLSAAYLTGSGDTLSAAYLTGSGDTLSAAYLTGSGDTLNAVYLTDSSDISGVSNLSESDDMVVDDDFGHLVISGSYTTPVTLKDSLETAGAARLKIAAEGSCESKVTMYYDIDLFGPDYFYEETALSVDLGVEISLGAGINDDDVAEALGRDDLTLELASYDIPTNIPGLTVKIAAEVQLEFDFLAGGTLTTHYTSVGGTIYETGHDTRTYKSQDREDTVAIEGEFEVSLNPQVDLGVHVLGEVVSASIGAGAKIEIEGETESSITESRPDDAESYHACNLCIDAEVSLYLGVFGELKFRLTDTYRGEYEFKILGLQFDPVEFYVSVDNDPFSPFGAHVTAGLGNCPNYVYLITVQTADENGETVTGIPLTITRSNNTVADTGSSEYELYLYPDTYTVTADFGDGDEAVKAFTVLDSARTILVQQAAATFSGRVTDDESHDPISGAAVIVSYMLIAEDGTETTTTAGTAATDANGEFIIENLKPGEYDVTVTASGYTAVSDTISLSDNQEKTHNYEMTEAEQVGTINGSVIDKDSGGVLSNVTVTATANDGEGMSYTTTTSETGSFKIESIPYGTYTLIFTRGGYETVTKSVELSKSNKIEYCYFIEMQKAAPGTFSCTVTNTNGYGISGATVSISGDDYNDTVTASDGTCSVSLPAGTYTVIASADNYAAQRAQITIASGETTEQTFALEIASTGSVKITVKGKGYVPETDSTFNGYVEGAAVTLKQVGSDVTLELVTDADGTTGVVSNVPNGTYDVTVEAEGFITATTTLDVAKSKTTKVTKTLETEGNIYDSTSSWNWKYDSGVLTISGTGSVHAWDGWRGMYRPWATSKKSYVKSIKKVVVGEGITILSDNTFGSSWWMTEGLIGYESFLYHQNLTEVKLPSTLVVISYECFYFCPIESINLPDGLIYIGASALNRLRMSAIYVPASVVYVGEYAFPSNVTIYYGGTEEDAANWDLDLTNMTVYYNCTREAAETAISAADGNSETE